jgi:hypothetical protein
LGTVSQKISSLMSPREVCSCYFSQFAHDKG